MYAAEILCNKSITSSEKLTHSDRGMDDEGMDSDIAERHWNMSATNVAGALFQVVKELEEIIPKLTAQMSALSRSERSTGAPGATPINAASAGGGSGLGGGTSSSGRAPGQVGSAELQVISRKVDDLQKYITHYRQCVLALPIQMAPQAVSYAGNGQACDLSNIPGRYRFALL